MRRHEAPEISLSKSSSHDKLKYQLVTSALLRSRLADAVELYSVHASDYSQLKTFQWDPDWDTKGQMWEDRTFFGNVRYVAKLTMSTLQRISRLHLDLTHEPSRESKPVNAPSQQDLILQIIPDLVQASQEYDLYAAKTLGQIKQVECIARGFGISEPLPPISRIELSSLAYKTGDGPVRCLALRQTLLKSLNACKDKFHVADRSLMSLLYRNDLNVAVNTPVAPLRREKVRRLSAQLSYASDDPFGIVTPRLTRGTGSLRRPSSSNGAASSFNTPTGLPSLNVAPNSNARRHTPNRLSIGSVGSLNIVMDDNYESQLDRERSATLSATAVENNKDFLLLVHNLQNTCEDMYAQRRKCLWRLIQFTDQVAEASDEEWRIVLSVLQELVDVTSREFSVLSAAYAAEFETDATLTTHQYDRRLALMGMEEEEEEGSPASSGSPFPNSPYSPKGPSSVESGSTGASRRRSGEVSVFNLQKQYANMNLAMRSIAAKMHVVNSDVSDCVDTSQEQTQHLLDLQKTIQNDIANLVKSFEESKESLSSLLNRSTRNKSQQHALNRLSVASSSLGSLIEEQFEATTDDNVPDDGEDLTMVSQEDEYITRQKRRQSNATLKAPLFENTDDDVPVPVPEIPVRELSLSEGGKELVFEDIKNTEEDVQEHRKKALSKLSREERISIKKRERAESEKKETPFQLEMGMVAELKDVLGKRTQSIRTVV